MGLEWDAVGVGSTSPSSRAPRQGHSCPPTTLGGLRLSPASEGSLCMWMYWPPTAAYLRRGWMIHAGNTAVCAEVVSTFTNSASQSELRKTPPKVPILFFGKYSAQPKQCWLIKLLGSCPYVEFCRYLTLQSIYVFFMYLRFYFIFAQYWAHSISLIIN